MVTTLFIVLHVVRCNKTKNRAAGAEGGTSADDRPVSKKSKGHWARDVSAYDILEPIGEGTYGKVGPIVYPTIEEVFLSTNGPDRTVNLFLVAVRNEEGAFGFSPLIRATEMDSDSSQVHRF